jgi:hypothetical protein
MTTEAQATIAQVRAAMVSNCNWGVAHNAEIHYAETRPIPINIPKYYLPFTTDCSGFVGVAQDGIWDPLTTEGLQRSLNANTF